jgi:WD repeat-containing protein mio
MSGTLAALSPPGAQNIPQLRDHCERLIVRLQDPYFRALLTYLTSNDWSEVLEEEALPFRERLAIAFQFLDDSTLSSYLRRIREGCCARGDIEGLILTGMTPMSIDILQSYVDRTGDVQSATILSAYISSSRDEDPRVGRWRDAYRDLLDGFKLFYHRVEFDIERGRLLQQRVEEGKVVPFTWAPKQIRIRCKYCNKPISKPDSCSKQEMKVC